MFESLLSRSSLTDPTMIYLFLGLSAACLGASVLLGTSICVLIQLAPQEDAPLIVGLTPRMLVLPLPLLVIGVISMNCSILIFLSTLFPSATLVFGPLITVATSSLILLTLTILVRNLYKVQDQRQRKELNARIQRKRLARRKASTISKSETNSGVSEELSNEASWLSRKLGSSPSREKPKRLSRWLPRRRTSQDSEASSPPTGLRESEVASPTPSELHSRSGSPEMVLPGMEMRALPMAAHLPSPSPEALTMAKISEAPAPAYEPKFDA